MHDYCNNSEIVNVLFVRLRWHRSSNKRSIRLRKGRSDLAAVISEIYADRLG